MKLTNVKTKINATLISALVSGMTRDDLRNLAKRFEVKTGKNRSDTEKNVAKAIEAGTIKFTSVFYFSTPPTDTDKYGTPVYRRKIRNTDFDKVEIDSINPAPVAVGESEE